MGGKGDKTRSKLVSAAREAFERDGFSGAGLNAILDASGAPRGSLYFHFPGGKEELALAAVAASIQQLAVTASSALAGARSASAGIARVLKLLGDRMEEAGFERGCPICSIVATSADAPLRVREAAAGGLSAIEHGIADYLASHGHASAEAGRLASVLLSMIEGALLIARIQRSREPLSRVAKVLPKLLDED